MADKQIIELTEATVLNSTDALVIGRGTQALKLLGSTLINYISRNVVSVTVTTLPAGAEATASFDPNTGVLSLGIPKGDTGDAGTMATPTVAGIMKLFTESGTGTDGTMTQDAITRAIAEAIADAAFVSYSSAQSLTETQMETARNNILAGAGRSNRNLLDNPWFTVYQRGKPNQTMSSDGFAIDRWKTTQGVTIVSNADNTVTISKSGGGYSTFLGQTIESDLSSQLAGKLVTLSADIVSGTVLPNWRLRDAAGAEIGRVPLSVGINKLTFTVPSSGLGAVILEQLNVPNPNFTIRAAKLELGPISTLANDIAPDYGEELRKCQRYLRVLTSTGSTVIGEARAASTSVADNYDILSFMDFAKDVTVAFSGSVQLWLKSSIGTTVNVSAISVIGHVKQRLNMRFTASALTNGAEYLIFMGSGAKIIISAEL